jgi:hypothetical protein
MLIGSTTPKPSKLRRSGMNGSPPLFSAGTRFVSAGTRFVTPYRWIAILALPMPKPAGPDGNRE